MPALAAIHRYPIKSTAGSSLQRARVEEEGLVGDRRFMVVKPDGTLHFAVVQSAPFTRPDLDDLLEGLMFTVDKGYPTRGTLT